MPSAADAISAAIADAGGAIPFERFVELALYGDGGFYTAGGRAGRRGDFITSPEVGPLFGELLGHLLDRWWDELGRPDPFTVVDAGAGPGTLARSIGRAPLRCRPALRYVAVEVSADQRAMHPPGVEPSATLPDGPLDGVVLANELLDNLPFGVLVHDGGWREAWVIDAGGGRFAEVLRPLAAPLTVPLPPVVALGARVPVQVRAGAWVRDACRRLRRGRVVAIDYAVPTTAELAARPWRSWLRTHRGHQPGRHPLRDPGDQDITADVALDQVAAVAGPPSEVCTQAELLQAAGIDELVEEGRRVWRERAGSPDLEAMRMRSRISEAEALLDRAGLGGFTVACWTVSPGGDGDPSR